MPKKDLTKEQEYYIKGNLEVLSEGQIATDLRLPVERVREYAATIEKDTRASRVNSLMKRPARGVVAMTEEASMAADDFKKGGRITQDEINRASAAGNYELAARLAEQRERQQVDSVSQQQARYGHCVHFIRPPGYEPPVKK
jgi:phospholipase/lecithinase/hemolysin